MSHEPSSVGVVGAGPAGLAAALTLAFEGVPVHLYDVRPEPGGRMRTSTLEGVRLDVGVQLLGSYYTETFALAARAGVDGLLVRAPGAMRSGERARRTASPTARSRAWPPRARFQPPSS